MSSETKLTRDKDGESVDNAKYYGMIGSLLYLMDSRLDIVFNVCLCAYFQEDPKTSHLEAVKRFFRYIKGTIFLGLWYPKGIEVETIVYADFDHAGDYVDRKSTSGVCTFMGCCLTSWFSKKKTVLAISTTKAKYVSVGKACRQALWVKQALIDYDIKLDDIPILCDNKGAIELTMSKSNNDKKDNKSFKRTTRISIRACCFVNPPPSYPPYQHFSPPIDYQTTLPSTPLESSLTSPMAPPGFSPTQLLTTPKTTLPPLNSPSLEPSQPSKQKSHLAINLEPIELVFSTLPPYLLIHSLTTNPPLP
ncbi:hypothetical protein Tco_1363676 [Tanacetum coccineum]